MSLSAPRQGILWGVLEGGDNARRLTGQSGMVERLLSGLPPSWKVPSFLDETLIPLIVFDINLDSLEDQLFSVASEVTQAGLRFGVVALQIVNNWGHVNTTLCSISVLELAQ